MRAGYEDFAGRLVLALRQAIETDLSDAEEREVRQGKPSEALLVVFPCYCLFSVAMLRHHPYEYWHESR